MASASNPSVGQLERLPAEIRLKIYSFAISSSGEEVDITKPCHLHSGLAFVSKQIHHESIAIIRNIHESECAHTRFTCTIPSALAADDIVYSLRAHTEHSSKRHNWRPTSGTIRLLTGHLGNDMPLAIVFNVSSPTDWGVEVYGASKKRQYMIEHCIVFDVMSRGNPETAPFDLEDVVTLLRRKALEPWGSPHMPVDIDDFITSLFPNALEICGSSHMPTMV